MKVYENIKLYHDNRRHIGKAGREFFIKASGMAIDARIKMVTDPILSVTQTLGSIYIFLGKVSDWLNACLTVTEFVAGQERVIFIVETPIPKAKRSGIGKLNNPAQRRV